MNIQCNHCQHTYKLEHNHVTIRYLKQDYRKVSFVCPKCNVATHGYYTNNQVTYWQNKLATLRKNAGKSDEAMSKYNREEEHYQELFDKVQEYCRGIK